MKYHYRCRFWMLPAFLVVGMDGFQLVFNARHFLISLGTKSRFQKNRFSPKISIISRSQLVMKDFLSKSHWSFNRIFETPLPKKNEQPYKKSVLDALRVFSGWYRWVLASFPCPTFFDKFGYQISALEKSIFLIFPMIQTVYSIVVSIGIYQIHKEYQAI